MVPYLMDLPLELLDLILDEIPDERDGPDRIFPLACLRLTCSELARNPAVCQQYFKRIYLSASQVGLDRAQTMDVSFLAPYVREVVFKVTDLIWYISFYEFVNILEDDKIGDEKQQEELFDAYTDQARTNRSQIESGVAAGHWIRILDACPNVTSIAWSNHRSEVNADCPELEGVRKLSAHRFYWHPCRWLQRWRVDLICLMQAMQAVGKAGLTVKDLRLAASFPLRLDYPRRTRGNRIVIDPTIRDNSDWKHRIVIDPIIRDHPDWKHRIVPWNLLDWSVVDLSKVKSLLYVDNHAFQASLNSEDDLADASVLGSLLRAIQPSVKTLSIYTQGWFLPPEKRTGTFEGLKLPRLEHLHLPMSALDLHKVPVESQQDGRRLLATMPALKSVHFGNADESMLTLLTTIRGLKPQPEVAIGFLEGTLPYLADEECVDYWQFPYYEAKNEALRAWLARETDHCPA